jgi:hypothetical protein
MKTKYRVRWNPKLEWFEIEKKYLFWWSFVVGVIGKEKAIECAKQYYQGLVVWESEK